MITKDCNFGQVTAAVHHDEALRDSFIAGLRSNYIRQRLLEKNDLDLTTAFTTARNLDVAQKSSETYASASTSCAAANLKSKEYPNRLPPEPPDAAGSVAAASRYNKCPKSWQSSPQSWQSSLQSWQSSPQSWQSKCYLCGYDNHPRSKFLPVMLLAQNV
jgi:hypothetical protein